MKLTEALAKAKEGYTVLAVIHGTECKLTFQKRSEGCGLYKISYQKGNHITKDTFLSEHDAEAEWFLEAQPKGLTLAEILQEIDDQP